MAVASLVFADYHGMRRGHQLWRTELIPKGGRENVILKAPGLVADQDREREHDEETSLVHCLRIEFDAASVTTIITGHPIRVCADCSA